MVKLKTSTQRHQFGQSKSGESHNKGNPQQSSEITRSIISSGHITRKDLGNDITAELKNESNEVFSSRSCPIGNIKFIPVKIKDLLRVLQNDQVYYGQPHEVKKNITHIEQFSQKPLNQTTERPLSPKECHLENKHSPHLNSSDSFLGQTSNKNDETLLSELSGQYPTHSWKVPTKNQQELTMPHVQAFPMIGSSGFRLYRGSRQERKRSPNKVKRNRSRKSRSRSQSNLGSRKKLRSRKKSRSHSISQLKPTSRSRRKSGSISKSRSRNRPRPHRRSRSRSRSRTRNRSKSQDKIRIQRTKPKHHSLTRSISVHHRPKHRKDTISPVFERQVKVLKHKFDRPCCNQYPLCENDCNISLPNPIFSLRKPLHRANKCIVRKQECSPRCVERASGQNKRSKLCLMLHEDDDDIGKLQNCPCKSRENLQFIQPGLCSKKKKTWTNEYAIIPQEKVNLMDPCEELDPIIHPRANKPCIRDSRGNPLTDCIGRSLRDPTGVRFLRFSGNGSVMDTGFRGNFYSGQPPLCAKHPFPKCSCAPDTTHNWWMDSGYPIKPDMSQFFRQVARSRRSS